MHVTSRELLCMTLSFALGAATLLLLQVLHVVVIVVK